MRRKASRDAKATEYRNKEKLLDGTYADSQAVGHVRAGSANRDGLATSKSEEHKRSHYARPVHASFDELSYKLASLAVERFGRLGKEGSDLIDQMAANIVRGTDGSYLARKGVCEIRPFQNPLSDHSRSHIPPSPSV